MRAYLSDVVLLYLDELIDWDSYLNWRRGEASDAPVERAALREVLETAAQICAEQEPKLRAGWAQSARLEQGQVVYPPHIAETLEKLRAAGLVSFGVDEQYGGFGLPAFVANVILQMVSRADAGLMTILGLQAGVAEDIQRYGSEELKQQYLPRFASGEVMGAMDLTEPQAGSDLGAIQTRATTTNGRTFVDGDKIFITNGGCEIHLVLARDAETFDQSKGTTKGLSLYLVPRTGADGKPNGVSVTRLEEKLGIHGSPTAAVRFEHAEGWLVGQRGQGFNAMLSLMNNARLGVAAQGIGIGEAALDTAIRYARTRVQFGVPIADQPLMQDRLARMTLELEGSRALLYRACALADQNRAIETLMARVEAGSKEISEAHKAELQALHERNDTRIRLLTPLAKYMGTEAADSISRDAIQIHGGVGFMAESEVGKLHHDAIITTIYEGTSEIQVSFALKEIGKGALGVVFEVLEEELKAFEEPRMKDLADKVLAGMQEILGAAGALLTDFKYAMMSAQALADVVASVLAAGELLKQAKADPRRFDLAASWIDRRMVDLEARCKRIKTGSVARLDRCASIIALAE
ncbi:MAG: acyl-CoA dehydrogenase family protein [Deltaproteobacteria bacterium]|nr:acyl-CoA dehydrogenase family protein [Deltaproteobacteria bacterium]